MFIATGSKPQCKPNITRICQKKPNSADVITPLISKRKETAFPTAEHAHVEIGPITIKASGTVITKTKQGRKTFLTSVGKILFNQPCSLLAKYVAAMIGITVDV